MKLGTIEFRSILYVDFFGITAWRRISGSDQVWQKIADARIKGGTCRHTRTRSRPRHMETAIANLHGRGHSITSDGGTIFIG